MRQQRARLGLDNKFYLLLEAPSLRLGEMDEATSLRLGEMDVLSNVQKANRESKNEERKNEQVQMKE